MATLKDIIRQEFKTKIEEESFSSIIEEKELNKQTLINSIEALLPDKDWKELEKMIQKGYTRKMHSSLLII